MQIYLIIYFHFKNETMLNVIFCIEISYKRYKKFKSVIKLAKI